MNIYVLFVGTIGDGNGIAFNAFKTKKSLNKFVKHQYPNASVKNRVDKSELYWETENGWLRAEEIFLNI